MVTYDLGEVKFWLFVLADVKVVDKEDYYGVVLLVLLEFSF